MNTRTTRMLAGVTAVAALVTMTATASPRPTEGDAARSLFERFKAIEGSWQTTSTAGWNEVSTFEVIARGSVVMGITTFRDAPDRKMVTMYYLDGDELVAVHYCEARNQPFLVASKLDAEAGEVTFNFRDGGNIPTRDRGHMDQAVYRFVDGHRFSSRWTWYQDGEEQWLEEIEYRRIR